METVPPQQASPTPAPPPPNAGAASAQGASTVHIDPVCGKQVQEKTAYRRTMLYRDVTMYFCSEECFREFARNPEYYGQKALPTVILQKPKIQDPITPYTNERLRQVQGAGKKQ
jgi:YHS domain-containing protein